MDKKLLIEDYKYLYEALKKQPLLLDDKKERQFEQKYKCFKEQIFDFTS